ncbi:MAG: glycoside hydrolase family 9 protein [Candidatus Cyclobacteriaceae bacterium M3_2C_046]
MKPKILIFLFILFPLTTWCADLVDFSPITDRVLMLHFSEGYVDHFGLGQSGDDDKIFENPLPLNLAEQLTSYRLISLDDPDYRQSMNPVELGRKTKGSDFTQIWPPIQPYIKDHYIYLVFPAPLKTGNTYRLHLNDLAQNTADLVFEFDETKLRSETIHVNNLGYVPGSGMKYAYLSHWMGSLGPLDLDPYQGNTFHLINLENFESVYQGQIRLRKDLETGGPDSGQKNNGPFNNFAGADLWECNFSDFNTVGTYVISVEGIGCSFPFRLDEDVYREAFNLTVRGLYHQRSGIALEKPYTNWTRGRDHHPEDGGLVLKSDWRYMDGRNAFEELPQYSTGEWAEYWGGWHDAGDWDRHHKHMNASAALLTVYELVPSQFTDGEHRIPESGNGIPDIIDEAQWCVDLFKRMQEPDGGIHGGLETFRHPETGVGSVQDTDQWYAYATEPQASYHYAAVASQLAYNLAKLGKTEEADEYLVSAKAAFTWAGNNLRAGDEAIIRDDRHYASAWLYKATGDLVYLQRFQQDNQIISETTLLAEHQKHNQEKGTWAYATTDQPGMDLALKDRLTQATINWARVNNIQTADKRTFRVGYDWYYPSLVGAVTTPKIMPLLLAYQVSQNREFLDYAYASADYYLGANPLNMTWVTGLADRYPREILHLDSWYYHEDKEMIPGVVPYGPYYYDFGEFNGPWSHRFGQATTSPEAALWPVTEMWFENRYCPITNEYTVTQTIGPAAAAYGFLSGGAPQNLIPSIRISQENRFPVSIKPGDPYEIKATASDQDGAIAKMQILKAGEVLQESEGASIIYIADKLEAGNHFLQVKAIDNQGGIAISLPVFLRLDPQAITGLGYSRPKELKVWPNPVGKRFYLQLPFPATGNDFHLKIYNTMGQEIPCESRKDDNQLEVWPSKSWKSGLYHLKVLTPDHNHFTSFYVLN